MAHSYEEDEPNMERHIHYNKRGELQMVGQKSLFDLEEPIWHADEKVSIRHVFFRFVVLELVCSPSRTATKHFS